MERKPLLSPRFVGSRFAEHSVPLELLQDIASLQSLIVEVAKWQYLTEHSNRTRTPRNFTKGLEIRLTGVTRGSAVINLELAKTSPVNFLPGMVSVAEEYCIKAVDLVLKAMQVANNQEEVNQILPKRLLGYFSPFGKSLGQNEQIEFDVVNGTAPVIYSLDTRRYLLSHSDKSQEFLERVQFRGTVRELNQDNQTFQLKLSDDSWVEAPYDPTQLDALMEAFNSYSDLACRIPVLVEGEGRPIQKSKDPRTFKKLEHLEQLELLHPLDVSFRLESLKLLKDGWFDGAGVAINGKGLITFEDQFLHFFPERLPLPYIYPTIEGGIELEWEIESAEAGLEIDLKTLEAEWSVTNLQNGDHSERLLDLNSEKDWLFLIQELETLLQKGQ